MPRNANKHRVRDQLSVWLPTVFFESLLIVASIMLALWLDERRDDSERQELMNRSVLSFERELTQNKRRVADVYPYHQGLHTVLERMGASDASDRIGEFGDIMSEIQVGALFNSSWETAHATGALTRMDFDLVSALSLTYSIQERFEQRFSTNIVQLANTADLDAGTINSRVFVASRFLGEMIEAERELDIYYETALEEIGNFKLTHRISEESGNDTPRE